MPLKLPNLDDRRYKDLVEEARGLIPAFAPEWSNHNPSDPGITLIEMFAYLTEMMLYRANRVSGENKKKFLKLLNEPDWIPGNDSDADTRRTVQGTRRIYRAVTRDDYEILVTEQFNVWLAGMQLSEAEGRPLDEWWGTTRLDSGAADALPSRTKPITRARCVVRRYLGAGTESGRLEPKPGHVSVIIVPGKDNWATGALGPQPTATQRQAVWGYLDERRMITTRHHVVGPLYAPVSVEGLVVQRPDIAAGTVSGEMTDRIQSLLDPLPDNGKPGRPFGRDVYVSELCEALESIQGVDYIPDLMLASVCGNAGESCVAAESLWHDEGDQIGLAIPEHQLPALLPGSVTLVVAPASKVHVISVTIDAVLAPAADPALAKRTTKQAVRRFFHPLHDGPKQDAVENTLLAVVALRAVLSGIGELQQIRSIEMQSDSSSYRYDTQGTFLGVEVQAGKVVDARLRLSL